MKRQNTWHWKMSLPGWKVSSTLLEKSRCQLLIAPDESDGPKWKCLVVDVSGGENKVWCYKEQYCIGTWNVRFMNRDKLKVVKQEMETEHRHLRNQWTKMGKVNSDDLYIYYCRQEFLRRNGVALIVNKTLKCSTGVNPQNDRMISVRFQVKPFNVTVIQICAPTTDAKEAEVDWF